jgi:hypothetical protein
MLTTRRLQHIVAAILVLPAFAATPARAEPETLTYDDLLERLVDLEYLATLPHAEERGAMWSSYDRRSRYDEKTGTYVEWQANADGTGMIRPEGDAIVIAEMEGPGCIWRIWSALAEAGHVKIHLDGAEIPAVDLPFDHYFTGEHAPFDYPALSYTASRGRNLYFPIPYQHSCRITADPEWGRYYQITYTTFPDGTQVPTFSTELAEEHRETIERIERIALREDDPPHRRHGSVTTRSFELSIPPGEAARLPILEGPAAIDRITIDGMSFDGRSDEMAAMRQLVLTMTWDDARRPAVWCPLGDFFGSAPGINEYAAFPLAMSSERLVSDWYMPFAKQARIMIRNDGSKRRSLTMTIAIRPLDHDVEAYGRFHCKWHRNLEPLPDDRWPDWTVLDIEGRGRFCGMALHVWNPNGGQCAEAGEGRWWWGEGDEKFFVDDEPFPSTFGTGTEDYFGYAWCHPDLFHRPFHNQTMTEQNAGHQSVNRFHIADQVPFHTAFEATLEKYFPDDYPTLYAVTAYWYMAPGDADPIGPTPVARRHGYYVRPPVRLGGFEVIDRGGGAASTQLMSSFGPGVWTDDDQLWWIDGRPGDVLTLNLPVERTGRYEIAITCTKAIDYGIVQYAIDGEPIGDPVDGYNDGVIRVGPIVLGSRELTAGDHTLTIAVVGANEQAEKRYMVGLDDVILRRVDR